MEPRIDTWPQPPRRRDLPLPAAARPKPGALAAMVAGGVCGSSSLILLSIDKAACHWRHVMA